MARKSNDEGRENATEKNLEFALRSEIARGRKLIKAKRELEKELEARSAEAEKCHATLLAYNAEMNRLAAKIHEIASLVDDSYTQCTIDRYDRLQRLIHGLRARLALNVGAAGPLGAQDKLSRQESRILGMVEQGLTSQEIAGKLSLSVHTVDTHRRNIRRKLKTQINSSNTF